MSSPVPTPPLLLLKTLLILVFLDGAIELALAESCISWVNHGAAGPYPVLSPLGSDFGIFAMASRPKHLLFSSARAASAAGGLAFSVVALGGFLALWLRDRSRFASRTWAWTLIQVWPYVTIVFALFTLAVTIALNVQTNMHAHQQIDRVLAEGLGPEAAYPMYTWTLPNFYAAVKGLVVDGGTVRTINSHLATMRGWRWNLVVLVVLQALLSGVAWVESRRWAMRARTESAVRMGVVEGTNDGLERGVVEGSGELEKGMMS
ncbi:hypothetical protein GE09DRAFT_1244811 [Coniochaeta sp. 2T2.1]|nr:hypothetical protein GE09DRAFT_1244811 [Coniochaeta sp. 2T2.1]